MAIKVNGTTVIDNSRNLQNVGGLKTVNGTSLVGSGNISAGASTSYASVGTYTIAAEQMTENETIPGGTTRSGSGFKIHKYDDYDAQYGSFASALGVNISSSNLYSAGLSGTWRHMAPLIQEHRAGFYGSPTYRNSLWVRIS
jgi:hypothetical protein